MALSESGTRLTTRRPVGRRRELRQLVAGVREASSGRIGLLHLRGPRGIGKSSTIELLRDEMRDEADVLVTTCAGQEDFAAAKGLFGAETVEALLSGRDEYARLYAMNDLVAPRTTERPLVLVLDDAHRCDGATARWLGVLARRIPEPRVYVVLVYPCSERVEAEAMFADLTGALDTTTIDLGQFDEADLTELVVRECGFVPGQELVRAGLASGAGLPDVALAWAGKLEAEAAQGGAPDVEAESVAWHLTWFDGQRAEMRRYVTAVAVLGSAAPVAAATLAGLSSAATTMKRVELSLVGLVADDGRFRSAVLRERLLDALDQDELCALRTHGARLLTDEGRPQEEVSELVMLLPALTEVWMFCALREAARAGTLSPELSISYLRRVLAAVPGHVDTRLELAGHLTGVDPSAAMDVYVELLADVTDPAARASVAVLCGGVALRAGRGPESFRLLTDYLAGEGPEGGFDPELRAQIEAVALVGGFSGSATVGLAMRLARTTIAPEGRAEGGRRLVQQLARAEVLRGDSLPAALAHVRSALPAPGGDREVWDIFPAMSLHFCGARTEAMTLADEVVDAMARTGDTASRKLALATRAGLAYENGELLDAERDARAALAIDPHDEDFAALAVLASVSVQRGDNDRTEQLLHRLGSPRGPVEYGRSMDVRARWLWSRGDADGALDVLRRCGREFDAMGVHNPVLFPWWLDAVVVTMRLGRTGAAAEFAEHGAALRWDTAAARGYALLATGLSTGHAETLEQAVAELNAAGEQLHEALALCSLGEVLMRARHEKAARKHLRAAVDIAVRCGASVAADRAHELLTAAGGRMSALHASPKDALTGGELRVAELAATGLTNREIAERLYITVRTVETHLSKAYRKLGSQTRSELAAQLR